MRQLERRAGSENSRAKQSQVAEGQPAGPQNRQSAAATRKARSEQLEKMLAEVLKSLPAEEGGNERLAEAALLVRLAAEKAAAATEAAGRDVDEEGNAAGQKRVERNETAAEAPSIDRDPRHREAFQQARQNYNRAAETLKNSQERLRVAEQSLREALGESNAASAGVSTAN
jgi:hypothetical protein